MLLSAGKLAVAKLQGAKSASQSSMVLRTTGLFTVGMIGSDVTGFCTKFSDQTFQLFPQVFGPCPHSLHSFGPFPCWIAQKG